MDEFDAVLEMEQESLNIGYQQGLLQGEADAAADATAMGRQKGHELGMELGMYYGRIQALLALRDVSPKLQSERIRKTLTAARDLLLGLRVHPQDNGCFETINELRAKMRMVDTMLGAASNRRKAETDLSF